jgi:hypothetical protein
VLGEVDEGLGRTASKFTEMIPDIDIKSLITDGAATGGVLSGPATGFPVVLHGTEAVVPLPDGKTIPVSIDAPQEPTVTPPPQQTNNTAQLDSGILNKLTMAVNQQTAKMDQLVTLMEKNNSLTSGILQHSM